LFCGRANQLSSVEHVLPRWARRDFRQPGAATLSAGDTSGSSARQPVAKIHHLKLTLNGQICQECNNGFLSRMENAVRAYLGPMASSAAPTTLDLTAQTALATWAVKTTLLLELAYRQHYPDSRPIEGYQATPQELAWLRAEGRPPPRSFVWLGCWDCQATTPLMYEPSGASLPTRDGFPLAGHLTTFALGFVAFQVFTVDFVAADEHGAAPWNGLIPSTLTSALVRIWPAPGRPIAWPPLAFAANDWNRLVTWDGVLRPSRPSPKL